MHTITHRATAHAAVSTTTNHQQPPPPPPPLPPPPPPPPPPPSPPLPPPPHNHTKTTTSNGRGGIRAGNPRPRLHRPPPPQLPLRFLFVLPAVGFVPLLIDRASPAISSLKTIPKDLFDGGLPCVADSVTYRRIHQYLVFIELTRFTDTQVEAFVPPLESTLRIISSHAIYVA